MSEIVENVDSDCDVVSKEKLSTFFIDQISLTTEYAVSLKKSYIHNLCGSRSLNIGVSLSDNSLEVYSVTNSSITKKCKLSGHPKKVTDIVYSNKHEHLLYSCSEDGTIKLWDSRQSGSNVMEYRDEKDEDLKPLESLDISCNDRVICAGSQMINGDAFIIFWDQRQPKPLGGYWNSHLDDITKVKFHKSRSDRIATASSDGLLNIFDIAEQTEDEALTYSLNVENAIESLNWLDDMTIASITQDNQVQIWNTETGDLIHSYTRERLAKGIKRSREDDIYVVNCYKSKDNECIILAGSHGGDGTCLRSVEVKDKKLKPKCSFDGNKQIVRCSWYHHERDLLITAGESGIISLWEKNQDTENKCIPNSILKSVKKLKINRSKPY